MSHFAIIEVEEGLQVAEMSDPDTAEEAASVAGGIVIDPGPYDSYEEAYDAMLAIEEENEDELL